MVTFSLECDMNKKLSCSTQHSLSAEELHAEEGEDEDEEEKKEKQGDDAPHTAEKRDD